MNRKFYKDKTILITGGAGSIGSELFTQLQDFQVKKIIILDQSELAIHKLKTALNPNYLNDKIFIELADIRSQKIVDILFKKHSPDIVFHAAALKHVPILEDFPSEAVLTNIYGTKNVITSAINESTQNFVFISTDKAVEPSSVMGASKKVAEHYINQLPKSQTIFSIVRFGNVYNSNGSAIELFSEQIEKGGPVTITNPNVERYFISIQEACKKVLEICPISNTTKTFIIDMGDPLKIVDIINQLIHKNWSVSKTEIEIIEIGLRKGEKIKEKLVEDTVELIESDIDKVSFFESFKQKTKIKMQDINDLIKVANERNELKVLDLLVKLSDLQNNMDEL